MVLIFGIGLLIVIATHPDFPPSDIDELFTSDPSAPIPKQRRAGN